MVGAFKKLNVVEWKQSVNIENGDIVYIYVGKPISGIKFKTEVLNASGARHHALTYN